MTTWAFDGKILAADSRETFKGDVLSDQAQKIYVGDNYVFTAAGEAGEIVKVNEWLKEDKVFKEVGPKVKSVDGLLWLKETGLFYRTDGRSVFLVLPQGEFATGGSGWIWARAALELGKNAVDAVKFACKFNVHSGGPVQTHTFDLKKKSKSIAKRKR